MIETVATILSGYRHAITCQACQDSWQPVLYCPGLTVVLVTFITVDSSIRPLGLIFPNREVLLFDPCLNILGWLMLRDTRIRVSIAFSAAKGVL